MSLDRTTIPESDSRNFSMTDTQFVDFDRYFTDNNLYLKEENNSTYISERGQHKPTRSVSSSVVLDIEGEPVRIIFKRSDLALLMPRRNGAPQVVQDFANYLKKTVPDDVRLELERRQSHKPNYPNGGFRLIES